MKNLVPFLFVFMTVLMAFIGGAIWFCDGAEMAFRVMLAMTTLTILIATSSGIVAIFLWFHI